MPPKQQLHLYLLMGQSNMVGRDSVAEQDRKTHRRIIVINRDKEWERACDPLPHTDPYSQGVGPGMAFARVMVEQDESITIGLIPCGKGGSALSQWVKGEELYKKAVKRALAAQKDGVLKGILWHQGESEIGNKAHAESYAERVTTMFKDLRKDLNEPHVPIVVGEIGHYLYEQDRFPYARAVNDALAQVPKRLDHAGVATGEELDHKGDGVHINTESQRKLGKRYAKVMLKVQKHCREEHAEGEQNAEPNEP